MDTLHSWTYRPIRVWAIVLFILFLISTGVVVTLGLTPDQPKPAARPPTTDHSLTAPNKPSRPVPSPSPPSESWVDKDVVMMGSLVTSVVTFFGFIFTTVLAWRKEKRESQQATIELAKTALELQQLRASMAAAPPPVAIRTRVIKKRPSRQ